MYVIARKMVEQAVSTFEDKTTLDYASAIDLGGLVDLDMSDDANALEPFNTALDIRRARLGPEDPFIAYSLNNIALAYTEMASWIWPTPRTKLRSSSDSQHRVTASGIRTATCRAFYSEWASPTRPRKCWRDAHCLRTSRTTPSFRPETPDSQETWSLLSRTRLAPGSADDALRLASKALTFRQELLGNRLKSCDSLYDVASLLLGARHASSAL